MHSKITAVIAVSSLLAAVSGSPLFIRGNTCGVAPTGPNTNNQPINKSSGIQTAVNCQAQCDANSSRQSFCFGMVNNVIECQLFSCAAAAVPPQPSGLVAYDKACPAVPSVVPTTSNPTGQAQGSQQQAASAPHARSDLKGAESSGQQQNQPSQAQSSQAQSSPAPSAQQQNEGSSSSANTPSGQQQNQNEASSSSANTCGSKPAGNVNNQPIAAPSSPSADDCKAKCKADSSCKSFTFGTVNKAPVCQLYSCEASAIPPPTNAAQQAAFVAYDVGCSI